MVTGRAQVLTPRSAKVDSSVALRAPPDKIQTPDKPPLQTPKAMFKQQLEWKIKRLMRQVRLQIDSFENLWRGARSNDAHVSFLSRTRDRWRENMLVLRRPADGDPAV
jgi:hypothetical protein